MEPQVPEALSPLRDACRTAGRDLPDVRGRFEGAEEEEDPLPQGDLVLPLLWSAAIAAFWLWKPWQAAEPQAMAPACPSLRRPPPAAAHAPPTSSRPRPRRSTRPRRRPRLTLPPNQTRHTVEIGRDSQHHRQAVWHDLQGHAARPTGSRPSTIISIGDELIIPLPVANTSTPTPTLTPSPTPFVYTVRTGDTLSAIAKRYNTTVEALMEANGITDATRIRVGTKLIIVQPPDFSATMAYEIYEVQQGDTLINHLGQVRRDGRRDQGGQRTGEQQPACRPGTQDPCGHGHAHAHPHARRRP